MVFGEAPAPDAAEIANALDASVSVVTLTRTEIDSLTARPNRQRRETLFEILITTEYPPV
jgi:hypothetical protein